MKDGGMEHIWPELPLFEIVTWSLKVNVSVGEQKMLQKLGKLHERWQQALQNKANMDHTSTLR